MKKVYRYLFWSIAFFHFVITASVIIKAFSMGMNRLDSGAPASGIERFLTGLGNVLAFPAAPIIEKWKFLQPPGIFGWIPFILNSMLWAGLILAIIIGIGKLRKSNIGNLR